ncbi:hypothetical protein VP1G_08798 [Cytospora mali]|uniref:Protein PAR32 n=1 Tax=Cytospora mali TaxID=578113 RepID=A0A194VCI3_CYTMA|nr:hypothetical protein VP1G_08798 [Valsa mali var. pyri (nom. inval.)]
MIGGGLTSLGRGGAGNMVDSTKSPKLQAQDLVTPTLKTSMVTTGRSPLKPFKRRHADSETTSGGQGNMAKNVDPEETRARQDVGPVPRRGSQGAAHSGRGGAGNFFQEGEQAPHSDDHAVDDKPHTHGHGHGEGLAAKGKALLFGKKDKTESK